MVAVLNGIVVLSVFDDLVAMRFQLRDLIFKALVFATAALVVVMDDQNFHEQQPVGGATVGEQSFQVWLEG